MKRSARWLLDSLWLVGLAFYVLAGVDKVPFHGDESTLIFMSRDYHYLVQQHDLDAVLYDPNTDHPTEQNIRMINGTTGKMAMGLAWDIAGLTVDDLNDQWAWGYTPEQNDLLGNRPSDDLLHAARLSSAVLLVISVWAVWGIARLVTRRRWAAYAASLIYVTSPAVLLNGRRAMMEGSQLGFTALAVLVAFWLLRAQPRSRRLMAWYTVFGAACGLAVASKHNVLITLGVLFVALALDPLLRPGRAQSPAGTPPAALLGGSGHDRRICAAHSGVVVRYSGDAGPRELAPASICLTTRSNSLRATMGLARRPKG